MGLVACTTPEEIAAEYRARDCISLGQERAVLQSRLRDANLDLAVSTTAAIITGDEDIELDSDIDAITVDELEERLEILGRVEAEKGCA